MREKICHTYLIWAYFCLSICLRQTKVFVHTNNTTQIFTVVLLIITKHWNDPNVFS